MLAALFEIGHLLQQMCGLGEVTLQRIRTCADNERGGIVGLEFQGFFGKLLAFRLVAAGKSALGGGNVRFDGVTGLPHGLVQIGKANLNAKIIGFGL